MPHYFEASNQSNSSEGYWDSQFDQTKATKKTQTIPPEEDIDQKIIKFINLQHQELQTKSKIEPFIIKMITHEVHKRDTRGRDVIISDFYTVHKAL